MLGLGNENYQMTARPKTIMCFICGREYGTKSLPIHIKSCEQKWYIQEQQKPKHQRRPLPKPPVGLDAMLGKGNVTMKEIEEFNNVAFDQYNEQSLVPCNNCGRTFQPESLVHHAKGCHAGSPLQKRIGGANAGGGGAQNENNFSLPEIDKSSMELTPCSFCGRKFLPQRLEKHEDSCDQNQAQGKQAPTGQGGMNNSSASPNKLNNNNNNNNNGGNNNNNTSRMEEQKKMTNTYDGPPPIVRPQTLMCFICGRQFGTTSLKIHVKSCQEKWLIQENKKPKNLRRAVPEPPPGLLELMSKPEITQQDLQQYNNRAFYSYKNSALELCKFCGRTFKPEALAHHKKACTAEQPFKPIDSQSGGGGSGSNANPQQFAEGNSNLSPCMKCGRKFAPDRILKHEAVCQGTGFTPSKADSSPSQGNSPDKLGSSGKIDDQQQSFKLNPQLVKQLSVIDEKSESFKTAQFNAPLANPPQPEVIQDEEGNQIETTSCSKCGRNFAVDRVAKHEKVCKGDTRKEQPQAAAVEPQETQQKPAQDAQWRVQHQEFVQNMKYMRELKKVEEQGGDIRSLPPPPQSKVSDSYTECPYCSRRFNDQAAVRHISICKNVINQPQPVPGMTHHGPGSEIHNKNINSNHKSSNGNNFNSTNSNNPYNNHNNNGNHQTKNGFSTPVPTHQPKQNSAFIQGSHQQSTPDYKYGIQPQNQIYNQNSKINVSLFTGGGGGGGKNDLNVNNQNNGDFLSTIDRGREFNQGSITSLPSINKDQNTGINNNKSTVSNNSRVSQNLSKTPNKYGKNY